MTMIQHRAAKWAESPVSEWRRTLESLLCCEAQKQGPTFVSLDQLKQTITGYFEVASHEESFVYQHAMAVVQPSLGAAYSYDSGIALAGSYLRRMPNGMQTPHCHQFYIEPVWHWQGIDAIEGPCIYLPFACFNNFGHFVTETISYLWAFTESASEIPSCQVIIGGSSDHDLARLVAQLIETAGHQVVFEQDLPSRFLAEQLYIPSSTFSLHNKVNALYLKTAQAIGRLITKTANKKDAASSSSSLIYLSRSKLPTSLRTILGENEIEANLAKRGWQILHPEQMPLDAQLNAYSQASVIAGFEGSAFHALAMCETSTKSPLIVMMGDALSPDFLMQFSCQGLNGYYARCSTPQNVKDIGDLHIETRQLDYSPKEITDTVHRLALEELNNVKFL